MINGESNTLKVSFSLIWHMFKGLIFSTLLLVLVISSAQAQIDQNEVNSFIQKFSEKHSISVDEVKSILKKATYQEEIVKKISRPAEGTMTWGRYRKIFVTEERAQAGIEFWKAHEATLNKVSEETGVSIEVILGIIGVESYFGKIKGSYNVLDALYTLGFGYPKRGRFFRSELDHFLVMAKEEKLDPAAVKGSYAGAMGYSQFMPSSYRAYAKSFEQGGTRDLMNSPEDAIASVANYIKVHRWKKGQPVSSKATMTKNITGLRKQSLKPKNKVSDYVAIGFEPEESLSPGMAATMIILENESGKEYWYGLDNFYVITRYNHSKLYAMAVFQLAELIKEKKGS